MTWLDLVREATPQQLVATGALAGVGNRDPVDGDVGWRPAGSAGRQVPEWTLERARAFSVAAYRSNPMARAIIDTYVSFCVGDSGVTYQVTNEQVGQVVADFWTDPRNDLGGQGRQELALRSELLLGERLVELLQGPMSGVVRLAPVDPTWIVDVTRVGGNPLWPDRVLYRWAGVPSDERQLVVAQVDDAIGLRAGECVLWQPFKALETDVRSMPFLMPVLDWLDNYDMVLSNLMDRTALARYFMWDVEVEGGQAEVNKFIAARGGTAAPPSGGVEVHNQQVKWAAKRAETGAYEDTVANKAVLTNVAAGAGLAKTWLAEPEDANRATSMTMAEPVRRRVQGVQKLWLADHTELVRFAVDRAVAAGRLPAKVEAVDPRTRASMQVAAAQTVQVTGPEIAAADSQITAQVLLNLATGLEKLVEIGALSRDAASAAARKAWQDFVGVPYSPDLDRPDANPDDVADAVDRATGKAQRDADRRAAIRAVPATT